MRWARIKNNWRRRRYPALAWLIFFAGINIAAIYFISAIEEKTAQSISTENTRKIIQTERIQLSNALAVVEHELKRNAQALAEWSELKAQLIDPSYYFYWIKQSLPTSQFWGPAARELALYNTDGQLLRKLTTPQLQYLPETVSSPITPLVLADQANQAIFLLLFQQVYNEKHHLLGYVGVAYDLKTALALSHRLPHLALSNIHVRQTGVFPLEGLMRVVEITPGDDPVIQALLQHISTYTWVFIAVAIVLIALNFYALYRLFFMPLADITRCAKSLHTATPLPAPSQKPSILIAELDHLRKLLFLLHRHWTRALYHAHSEREKYQQLALSDPVTQLGNRLALKAQSSLDQHPPHALVMIDIAFFRAINDTFGNVKGDEILKLVADFLKETFESDKNPVFRIGSDEFVVLIYTHSILTLSRLLDTLNLRLNATREKKTELSFPLKLRAGVALWEQGACTLSLCLKRADMALQYAKTHHKTVQFYDDELADKSLQLDHTLVQHIDHAVKTGQDLVLYFQPIVDASTGQICYHEVLMRITWQGELIAPDQAFQVIDRHHLHQQLDKTIIKKAAEKLAAGQIPNNQGISINLCAQTLLNEELTQVLSPLSPFCQTHTIVIEVLETTLMEQLNIVRDKLSTLRVQGFKIALDDFGSGFSSLGYLAELPVDTVKIDRSLTLRLMEDRHKLLIGEIIKLLNATGYNTVVEGIETPEQCRKVRKLGAAAMQGYLFSRPKPQPIEKLNYQAACKLNDPTPSQ